MSNVCNKKYENEDIFVILIIFGVEAYLELGKRTIYIFCIIDILLKYYSFFRNNVNFMVEFRKIKTQAALYPPLIPIFAFFYLLFVFLCSTLSSCIRQFLL